MGEDTELSRRYHKLGIVPRFNPDAQCYATEWRQGYLPSFDINKQKLGRLMLPPLEYTKRSLRPLRPIVMKINALFPGFSNILKTTGKSRLLFISNQSLDKIIDRKTAYSKDERIALTEIEISQVDKIQNVLYFTANDSTKQRKRYKAIQLNKTTEIYLDQVQ